MGLDFSSPFGLFARLVLLHYGLDPCEPDRGDPFSWKRGDSDGVGSNDGWVCGVDTINFSIVGAMEGDDVSETVSVELEAGDGGVDLLVTTGFGELLRPEGGDSLEHKLFVSYGDPNGVRRVFGFVREAIRKDRLALFEGDFSEFEDGDESD
jgi:hypothetical protein